ncbi:hypothetical protein CYQ88_05930 [Hydrogenovibrio sp. SC-1]|uniref:cbb3-type cytochrome c oxidase subunit 3 n=1 Tax=Hydrogenovibrio sp. SC-1 TaxID=2065820 RepID=UPI000C7AA327|nr:cbb3-type cytochrome c oxidase subunit 3 [Hydrogenovibrio sp. SC-1]PLA74420.1 hypothetical protein CYQ88_05930 [Hydrogenovibrio sp. SC-1]
MSKVENYFTTDWSAMTSSDWIGLTITVAVFIGMLVAFVWALRPSQKKQLEKQKYKILDDE